MLLDLPMDSRFGHDGIPMWNKLLEEHASHGLGIVTVALGYKGWVVAMAPIHDENTSLGSLK